ncbi:MAG: 16S rRNA (cytosine(967)-C(5))-methyltransferase RsmB [Gammaproteobacteria bacterium]
MNNPRITIALILRAVIGEHINLDNAFARHLSVETPQTPFIKAACFGVLRHYLRLRWYLDQLLDKPLKAKDQDLDCLLLSGLYELFEMHTPDHAVVSETVNATRQLRKAWAKGLVNAILRNARRQQTRLRQGAEQDVQARTLHPQWLLDHLQQDWPQDWPEIVAQNNLPAPMTLRLDLQHASRDEYLQQLATTGQHASSNPHVASALSLDTPVDVQALPGFAHGLVSVQDAAAQLAASLLTPQPGERILDACAAPGGKTLHLRQAQPALAELIALDSDAARLERVSQNLERARVQARLCQGDASRPDVWWDHQPFDRILLDAPCSATGVIRRHPDIKLLRQPGDLPKLAAKQAQILDALWPLLKSGGMLLYATCSVLKMENERQIQQFLARQPDASCPPITADWGQARPHGRQILPGMDGMDGFYYALIYKQD